MRALLAPAPGCRLRRAPPAAVCTLRQQQRGSGRTKEIRMSEAGNGGVPAPQAEAAGAARAMPPAASGWRWLPLAAAIIVADQAVKAWMVHHFALLERVHVLGVLDIILTYNTGAAFSFLSDASGWQRLLVVVLALGVSAALIVWMRRLRAAVHGLLACGLALIIGGALGHMIHHPTLGRGVAFFPCNRGHPYFSASHLAASPPPPGRVVPPVRGLPP